MWDVTIIGAGPAGLSAALTLNHLGVGVFLLDAHGYRGGMKRGGLPFDPREVYHRMIETADSVGIVPILGTANKIIPLEESLLTIYQGGEAVSKCVIIACGGSDISRFSDVVELTPDRKADVGEACMTKTHGVFVCGDARAKPCRCFVTAVADGAVAGTLAAGDMEPAIKERDHR